jgi:hypothetical protein
VCTVSSRAKERQDIERGLGVDTYLSPIKLIDATGANEGDHCLLPSGNTTDTATNPRFWWANIVNLFTRSQSSSNSNSNAITLTLRGLCLITCFFFDLLFEYFIF